MLTSASAAAANQSTINEPIAVDCNFVINKNWETLSCRDYNIKLVHLGSKNVYHHDVKLWFHISLGLSCFCKHQDNVSRTSSDIGWRIILLLLVQIYL